LFFQKKEVFTIDHQYVRTRLKLIITTLMIRQLLHGDPVTPDKYLPENVTVVSANRRVTDTFFIQIH